MGDEDVASAMAAIFSGVTVTAVRDQDRLVDVIARAQDGFAGASLRNVAQRAGYTTGALTRVGGLMVAGGCFTRPPPRGDRW